MGAKGDTGTSTGAVGKSNGKNPKDDFGRDITVPRLFYDSDSSQSLSTDVADPPAKLPYDKEYRFLLQEWNYRPDCSPNGIYDLSGKKNPKCGTMSWWPIRVGPDYYERQQPVIRVVVVHGAGPEATVLYRDFPLDGVLHGTVNDTSAVGYNLVLSGLPLKLGDRVVLYYFDSNPKESHPVPIPLNNKDWANFPMDKTDPPESKAFEDFINNASVIYERSFISNPELTSMPNAGGIETIEKALSPKF